MTKVEHLLGVLGEEGGEIAKETSKANRFGLDDIYPKHPEWGTNRARIIVELNDLLGVCRMLVKAGVLPADWKNKRLQNLKIEKVKRYMRYAKKQGTLSGSLRDL